MRLSLYNVELMKAKFIGEFSFERDTVCAVCYAEDDPEIRNGCEVCGGKITVDKTLTIVNIC